MLVVGGVWMVKGEEDILRFYGGGLMMDDGMLKEWEWVKIFILKYGLRYSYMNMRKGDVKCCCCKILWYVVIWVVEVYYSGVCCLVEGSGVVFYLLDLYLSMVFVMLLLLEFFSWDRFELVVLFGGGYNIKVVGICGSVES